MVQRIKNKDYSKQICSICSSAHLTDPTRHRVGAWGTVVRVDDYDSNDDGGDDKDHGEEHVLPNERHSTGSGGDELHDDQQEHGQREQDGDAEGHLLTWGDTSKPH